LFNQFFNTCSVCYYHLWFLLKLLLILLELLLVFIAAKFLAKGLLFNHFLYNYFFEFCCKDFIVIFFICRVSVFVTIVNMTHIWLLQFCGKFSRRFGHDIPLRFKWKRLRLLKYKCIA
jgi:hypothetical protein